MTYQPATLQALGIDADTASTPGNVAAHLVNLDGGGLNGINVGWRDMEASTRYLVAIVDHVDEALEANELHDDTAYECADAAVPWRTRDRVMAALELGLTSETPELGSGGGVLSVDGVAAGVLYDYALNLAGLLVEAVTEELEHANA